MADTCGAARGEHQHVCIKNAHDPTVECEHLCQCGFVWPADLTGIYPELEDSSTHTQEITEVISHDHNTERQSRADYYADDDPEHKDLWGKL